MLGAPSEVFPVQKHFCFKARLGAQRRECLVGQIGGRIALARKSWWGEDRAVLQESSEKGSHNSGDTLRAVGGGWQSLVLPQ